MTRLRIAAVLCLIAGSAWADGTSVSTRNYLTDGLGSSHYAVTPNPYKDVLARYGIEELSDGTLVCVRNNACRLPPPDVARNWHLLTQDADGDVDLTNGLTKAECEARQDWAAKSIRETDCHVEKITDQCVMPHQYRLVECFQ